MILSRLLFCAVTGALCLVLSSHAEAETLREAVVYALANHPGIEIASAKRNAAEEDEGEQFSNLFPEVSTTATGGRIFNNTSTTRGLSVNRGEAYSWLWEGSATVRQPLFDGFETYNRIDAARARENAAEFTLADARQGLALRAAQSFLNVMRAREAYEKTTSYQNKIKDYLSRINAMVDAGAADESEVAQAKNIQAQLENSVAEMEGQVKLALADYHEAVGSMPTGDLKTGESDKSLLFLTSDEAIEYADQNHPLLLSARKTLQAEEEEVGAEKGRLFPALDGELSYLKRDQKEDIGGETVDGRAVMRMNWAFSTGGGQLARIRKAKAEKSEALARAAQAQREIERDIRKAYAEYETALKQKELNTKRVAVTKNLFETYERQFEASKVRLLQLMQAENQLFTTELEQINSNYRVMMAEYSTLASTGRLLAALAIDGDGAMGPVRKEPKPSETVKKAEAKEEASVTPVPPLESPPKTKTPPPAAGQ